MSRKKTTVKSKLFKLKEWLTVPDAARHLSIIFGEEVSEADVLRLALDGHLKLSVYFVNHAQAICGEVVPYEDVEWTESSLSSYLQSGKPIPNKAKGNPKETRKFIDQFPPQAVMKSLDLDGERFLNLDKNVTTIRGVWDLSMVGNEKLDVEHKYQNLTDGPPVTLIGLDGAFVEKQGGLMCQLQESLDENEYHNGSGDYYPAGCLPSGSVLVVRTHALIELQERLSPGGESLEPLAETSLLNPTHAFHAKELKIAVEAWAELYEKNPPQHVPKGGHKKYITKWLEEKHPGLGQRARERISTVINPNPRGGASPINEKL